MTRSPPDHARLEALLQAAGAPQGAAEAHGIQCGLLCAGRSDWHAALLEPDPAQAPAAEEASQALEALWRHTAAALRERRLPLPLLLPADDRPAAERALALRDWAQGFLYGFGLGGARDADFFSSEAGEALRDFGEIARMDVERIGESEEDEEALMQLTEYLWVALSLIWHEINAHDAQ